MRASSELSLRPLTLKQANQLVLEHHRHSHPDRGCVCCVGLERAGVLVGAAIIGRPKARALQDGYTAEVTRLVVVGLQTNACSMLYGAAWRAVRALGYRRLVTYTLATEPGTSLRASGWTYDGRSIRGSQGSGWHTPGGRERHPGTRQVRSRWIKETEA